MSTIEINIDDLTNLCRLCLKSGENIGSIFDDNNKMWTVTDISQLIYNCTKIEVSNKNVLHSPLDYLGIFKMNFCFVLFIKVTVNDVTTGICLICYKEITSIVAFQDKCARANELLKRRCREGAQGVKSTTNLENEYVFTDLDDEGSVMVSNSLWEKSANLREISG